MPLLPAAGEPSAVRESCRSAGTRMYTVPLWQSGQGETWSEASIEVALKLAAVKFGRRPIRLTGSDEYRTAVLRVERRLRTGVRFQDEARLERLLERKRSREDDGR